ncbi:MAG: hypothetical protein PHU25_07695 [Deltaproteobacteria bacterium]|nr:hypothetical protein [Deltaproteobacteria bacterium]
MPTDRAALGDAFVRSWLAFRTDLDTMAHGNVHPALLGAWLDAAPRFLLDDVARLAAEPSVADAARARLGPRGERHPPARDEIALTDEALRGEAAMRRAFPLHHLMLGRRDPAGERWRTAGGMYETWFTLVGRAVASGARTRKALFASIDAYKRRLPEGDAGDIRRREIAALVEFWDNVDASIKATPAGPIWPAGFASALASLDSRQADPASAPAVFATRVAAEIALLAWLAPALGHERFAGPAAGLAVITPGGARAADGDLSTAWHGTAGRSLVFDLPNGAQAKALFLMGACPDKSGSRVLSVRVSGTSPAGAFSASRDLAANTLYFERVDLGVAASGRLTVEISKTSGPDPACVPEIRLGD